MIEITRMIRFFLLQFVNITDDISSNSQVDKSNSCSSKEEIKTSGYFESTKITD